MEFRKVEIYRIKRGPLLNFWVSPFWLPTPAEIDIECPELKFKGVEWWYQAGKVAHSSMGSIRQYLDIVEADTAREAKELGRQVEMDEEELCMWNGFVSVNMMLEGCLAKFWQNDDCAKMLIETGDKYLVEHRPDPRWGDNMDGSGKNLLGHILMLVRATIQ